MKIRVGFVSNSSSASFVLSVDSADKLKVSMNLELDLTKIDHVIIETIEELDKMNENFLHLEETSFQYRQMKMRIMNGKKVFVAEVDTGGYGLGDDGERLLMSYIMEDCGFDYQFGKMLKFNNGAELLFVKRWVDGSIHDDGGEEIE